MTTQNRKAPAKAGAKPRPEAMAKQYFQHGKELRSSVDEAATLALGERAEAYDAAMERLLANDPDAAIAVGDYVDALMGAVLALNDALYHECERRAIAPKLALSGNGRKGAQGRARNPQVAAKKAAKENALKFWMEWQSGQYPKIRRVEDFARETMDRWPVLTSAGTIEQWSAKWSKQRRSGENPTC